MMENKNKKNNVFTILKELGIDVKNEKLFLNAITHTSYANEHKVEALGKVESYERLEFLGDAVLDLVVSDYLFNHFKETEGEMTKVRASYVCENANYEYASSLDLSKYILVGNGEMKDGGRYKKAIVADIFEAMLGAIYIDLGFATVKKVIFNVVVPYIEDPNIIFFNDYKSVLQENVQTEQKSLEYVLVNEEGPAHERVFTVNVLVDDIVFGTGVGNSKKEAEQEAAKEALRKLAI